MLGAGAATGRCTSTPAVAELSRVRARSFSTTVPPPPVAIDEGEESEDDAEHLAEVHHRQSEHAVRVEAVLVLERAVEDVRLSARVLALDDLPLERGLHREAARWQHAIRLTSEPLSPAN